MATIKASVFSQVAEPGTESNNKVTVVGIGQVGMACAFSILTQVRIHIPPFWFPPNYTKMNHLLNLRRMCQVNWPWLMWLLTN